MIKYILLSLHLYCIILTKQDPQLKNGRSTFKCRLSYEKKHKLPFYRDILKERHGGESMETDADITDVTTDDMHIKITSARNWPQAFGEFLGHHYDEARKELRFYLFDLDTISDESRDALARLTTKSHVKFTVYLLAENGDESVWLHPDVSNE